MMMNNDSEELKTWEPDETALAEETGKKPGMLRGARDFLENTFSNLKGKDLTQAVEEFTSEMTLVAEGLSEDQEKLRQDLTRVDTQLTLLEEKTRTDGKGVQEEVSALQNSVRQMEKRLADLEKTQQSAASKQADKTDKKGLHAILKQVTVIVGLVCAAWVITAVIGLIR